MDNGHTGVVIASLCLRFGCFLRLTPPWSAVFGIAGVLFGDLLLLNVNVSLSFRVCIAVYS